MSLPLWPLTWYFSIHDPQINDPRRWLGHCDLWGVTRDDTWFFLCPRHNGFHVLVAHKAEEVDALWAMCLHGAARVYRYEKPQIERAIPPIAPLSCASICAHVLGLRAWTPHGLEQRLVRNGATQIWNASDENKRSEGGSGSQSRA